MLREAAIAAAGMFFFLPPLSCQQPVNPIVSVDWLARRIDDPNLVLIHVGPDEAYGAAHLPGARLLTREMLRAPREPGRTLEMPDQARLAADLASLGVTDRSTIVVVHDQEWVTPATRALVTLQYAGLGDRAALLDGGQGAWVRAGHPVTADVPATGRGNVTPRVNASIIVDVETVKDLARPGSGTRLVDARAPVFYDGPPHGEHREGHLPTAVNIPFTSIVNDDLTFKSQDALRALFDAAGIRPGEPIIVYCHIGQQATLVFTAARLLGHPVRLYDGSFDEWNHRNLPREGGRSAS